MADNKKLTAEEIALLQSENADLKGKLAQIETTQKETDAVLADARARVDLSGGILPMEVAIKCARDQAAWDKHPANPKNDNSSTKSDKKDKPSTTAAEKDKPPTEPAKN